MAPYGILHSIQLGLLTILVSVPAILPLMWVADQDSVIMEAVQLHDILKPRGGGRLPSSWPWNSMLGNSNSRSSRIDEISPHLTCYTAIGEVGRCSTLKSCYPSLYFQSSSSNNSSNDTETETNSNSTSPNSASAESGDGLQNSDLAKTLKDISGPCDLPFFEKFRMESEIPDTLICCPTRLTTQAKVHQRRPVGSKHPGASPVGYKKKYVPDAVAALVHRTSKNPPCGQLNNSIIGTEEHENERRFPWIVALIGKQGHFCSGTLVDKYHVLTAAQCVSFLKSEDIGSLRVFLGDYKLNTISDGPLISRRVARIIYHRHFSEQTLKNDVALIKLNLPAPIGTPKVLPICMPGDPDPTIVGGQRHHVRVRVRVDLHDSSEDEDLAESTIVLAGWGRSWIHSPTPILRKTVMRAWSNEDCRKKYGYLARSGGILDSMLCASSIPAAAAGASAAASQAEDGRLETISGIPDSIIAPATAFNEEVQDCIGDSGSPLMRIRPETGTYELVGITSWNIGCGNYPYVYSRVSRFMPWIEKNRRRH